jgi:hypothetical protein
MEQYEGDAQLIVTHGGLFTKIVSRRPTRSVVVLKRDRHPVTAKRPALNNCPYDAVR